MQNKLYEKQYLEGELEVEFIPQGTLAEKLRAGGNGIPAFYTITGIGTFLEEGGFPILNPQNGEEPTLVTKARDVKIFNGQKYLLEEALTSDYSIVKGWKADEKGNVVFRKSALNFNIDVAKAGKVCIVEVEEIVPTGSIDPNHVHLPHIFVQRLVKGDHYERRIEILPKDGTSTSAEAEKKDKKHSFSEKDRKRRRIAMRAARDVKDGMYINLGTGIPTIAPSFIDPDTDVTFQSENGILGLGNFASIDEADADLINAGKQAVGVVKGASFFSSSDSFGMIRGKYIDVSAMSNP